MSHGITSFSAAVVPPPERPPDLKKRSPGIAGTTAGAGLDERGRATTFSYELAHRLAPASSFNRLGDAAAGATLTAGFGGSQ
jgi:hypothetical protein